MLVGAAAVAAEKDDDVLAAGWYTLRSALELFPVSRWAEPLTSLVLSWDDLIWKKVAAAWSPVSAASNVRMPAVPKFDADRIAIKSPARAQAQAFVEEGNYSQFATVMQQSYVEHVDHLLSASEMLAAASHKRSVESLRSFASDLGTKLRDTLTIQERSIDSMRLRSDLLWWRQTGFSPTKRVGYSTLGPAEVTLVAAVDLHKLMPPVAPLAAEHLLFELVSQATNDSKLTLDELSGADAVSLLSEVEAPTQSLLGSVVAKNEVSLLKRDQQTGAGRLAVLLFRELQAMRLSSNIVTNK